MLLNKTREQYIDDLIAEGKTDEEILKLLEEFDVEPEPVDLGLGKPTDPVNVEASAGSEDTASKLDTGSSESQDEPVFDEFDASEELSTWDERIKSGFLRIGAKLSKFPAAVNQLKYAMAKPFMSDEQKEKLKNLTPEQEYLVIQAMFGGPAVPGNIGAGSLQGLKKAEELNAKAAELEKDFAQYERSIGQALSEGDIAEGATRLFTEAVGALPSVAQAIVPGGIASIFAGEYADAADRYVMEEGGRAGEVKGIGYSAVRASNEALLELTTRRLGRGLFKNLTGKPKSFVEKTLRKHFTDIAKGFGAEGASEFGTETLNRLADQVILGKEDAFENFYVEGLDVFLVGGVVGGKISTASAGVQMARSAAVNKSVKKTLENTSVNSVNEAFINTKATNDNVSLAKNKNSEFILSAELNQKVSLGEMTLEEANNIKQNFRNVQGAVKVAQDVNIGDVLINETVDLIQERSLVSDKIKKAGENKALVKTDVDRLAEIDTRLGEISAENQLNITTKNVTDIVSGIENINIEIANTQQEADKIAKDKNLDKKASSSQGFILQNKETGEQTIVINKDVAKADQAVNVAAHELLHGVLFQTVKNSPETAQALASSLKVEIDKIDTSILKDSDLKTRLDQYKNESSEIQAEETLTLFADAVANGEIKYEESTFDKIGNVVRRLLQQAGLTDIKFNKPKDVFNFIKDYNKSIVKGELTKSQVKLTEQAAKGGLVSPQATQDQTQVKQSKSMFDEFSAEELVQIVKSPSTTATQRSQAETALTNQFDLLALKAIKYDTRAGNIARENVVAEARAELPGIIERFNPESAKFSTFVTNTMAPKAQQIYENAKSTVQEGTSIDSPQAKQVADTSTPVETKVSKPITKIDPTKFDKVNDKMDNINNIVDIKPEEVATTTFKEVNDKFAGKVASEIFNVPEAKITDPKKNLTYAKKITNGIPENSEAGNIQDFIRVGQNAENFIKILPEENVSSETADIDALGENIDVSRDVLGRGLGLNNRMLNYFYNKTNRRSRGKTSQPTIWELKPEFRNPSPETVAKFKEDIGITPPGQLNKYDRGIGQILKGIAKLQGQNVANLVARNKVDESTVRTAKPKKQIKADIKSGASRIMLSKANKARNVFMQDQSFKKNPTEFAAENKNWIEIIEAFLPEDVKALNMRTPEGRQEYRNFLSTVAPKYLPESFLKKSTGTFTGTTAKLPDGTRTYKGNYAFLKAQEVKDNLSSVETYAKPDTDIEAAIKKEDYTNIEKKLNTDKFNQDQEASIRGLKKIFKAFEKMIADDKANAKFVGAMLQSTGSFQGHFIRTSAPVRFYAKNTFGKIVQEHTLPSSITAKYLFTSAAAGTIEQDFGNVSKNYFQGALPEVNDNALVGFKPNGKPYNYKENTPEGWKLTDNIWARYFNENVASIDPSNIILANGNTIVEEFGIDAKGFATNQVIENNKAKAFNKQQTKYSKAKNNDGLTNDLNNYDKALRNARNINAPKKGISVFDFDDTLATTGSKITVTMPDGTINKITPAEFAKQHSTLQEQGAEFNFDEFNKVVDGKPALASKKLQKAIDKFGNKDVYVLTARPQQSAQAIYEFLKGIGLEVPLENITGLEDGTPQAKANWMISKAAEGYNDFYFTDDVYKNVKAVQDALEVLDVKSKTRVAYADRITKLDKDFNDILEAKTGIGSEKVYSKAKAAVVGANKGKFKFFIPPSAEDFVGLLYNTLSKGKLGDNQMAWYKKNLLDPFAKANAAISRERISLMNDYKALKKGLGVVPKNLRKKIPGETFTNEQAVRVYIWNKQGMDIPNLSKTDQKELIDYIESKPQYKAFGDQLINIHKDDGYTKPGSGWLAGTITTDIQVGLGTTKRAKHLAEWQQNVDIIFSEKNLNKMEAAFGKAHRVALEGILQRMKTGRNRSFQTDSLTGQVTDWLTNSIGTIMFFNTRSALLQTISSVNFINFKDNNIFAAGKAFANQKQYWSDFMSLMNSDFLVDRRRGLRINVNEADIANMARESGPRGVISKMLEVGFLPTQIADSFAIASGGASFYRNRINTLKKQGLDQKAAEVQAMKDFREIAEESQQSSRPDRISAQQAGPLGRIILAFGNTPMQYARLIKKASSDLVNRRGDWKTNVSKIIYYAAVQNLIFNALQQAIFAIAFGDTDEEEDTEKYENIANGMADSLLRGVGIAGAFVSVGKNSIIRIMRESEKPNPKYEKIGYELTRISPPVSSKLSRVNQAARAFQWEKDEMIDKGFAIDNPALLAGANIISAATNIPIDRLVKKTNNVVDATSQDLETWERLALLGGWQDWEIGLDTDSPSTPVKKKSSDIKRGNTVKRDRVKRDNTVKRN